MKRIILIGAAALLAATSLLAAGAPQQFRFNTKGLDRVFIDHPVGDVTVKGTEGDVATVTMTVRCKGMNCDEKSKNIHLAYSMNGGQLVLKVQGFPKVNRGLEVDIDATIPRGLALSTDHGVGDVDINGMVANIKVDTGVGDVSITSPAAAFRHASVDAGVGSVDFTVGGHDAGEKHGFIGTEVTWNNNQGNSNIDLDLGVGRASVNLQ
jgi:hypothetical protein